MWCGGEEARLVEPETLFKPQGNAVIYFAFHLRRLGIERVLDLRAAPDGVEARVVRPRRQAVFPITSDNWFDETWFAKSIRSTAELLDEDELDRVLAMKADRPPAGGSFEPLVERLCSHIQLVMLEHVLMEGPDELTELETLLAGIAGFSRVLVEPDSYDEFKGVALTYSAIYLSARARVRRKVP